MITAGNLFAKTISRHRELLLPETGILEVSTESEGLGACIERETERAIVPFGDGGRPAAPISLEDLARALPEAGADVVVVHDLLEYLRPEARDEAVRTLLRLAARTLLVLCRCEDTGQSCDRSLAEFLKRSGAPVKGALARCEVVKYPSVRDVYRALEQAGASFDFVGNESVLQHHGGVLLDLLYPAAKPLYEALAAKTRLTAPVGEGEWDVYYNFLFEVRCEGEPAPAAPAVERRACEPGVQIYSVFHKNADGVDLGGVRPIFVGAAAEAAPPGALTDITTTVPRLDNRRWCELTAMYKVWKEGPFTDAVGFCHYRRFFDFSGQPRQHRETKVSPAELARRTAHLAPQPGFVSDLHADWIITPPPMPLNMSVFSLYAFAHATNDYCRAMSLLARRHPHLKPFVSEQLGTTRMHAANMSLLPWHLFSELCSIWFDVLPEYAAAVPPGRATAYQNREVGFLAERILDVWIRWKRREGVPFHAVPMCYVT